jgi:hypothetical protein
MEKIMTGITTAGGRMLRSHIKMVLIGAFLLATLMSSTLPISSVSAHDYNNCRRQDYYYSYNHERYWDQYVKRVQQHDYYEQYYHVYLRKYNEYTGGYYWDYDHYDVRHC